MYRDEGGFAMICVRLNADGVQSVTLEGPHATSVNAATWKTLQAELVRLDKALQLAAKRFWQDLKP